MPFTVGQYLTANDLKSQEDAHTLGNGVVNGLQVIPDAPPSMDIDVEVGKCYAADTLVVKGAVTTLAVGGADPANPRKDIVVCNSAGALSIVAGTPEAALPAGNVGVYTLNPEPDNIPANSIILAEIWVPAGAISITGAEIYDKRVFTVDRLGKARLEWALNKILKGAGAGSDPTEVDMPAAGWTPTGDGGTKVAAADIEDGAGIPLTKLEGAVCSETEADDKIAAQCIPNIASVGDNLEIAADEHVTSNETYYIKVKEIGLSLAGSYRIKFAFQHATDGKTATARVYRNGAPVGQIQTKVGTGYVTKTEDIEGWSARDLCQLYLKSSQSGISASAKDFRIYSAFPIGNWVIVN